jgi:hypothetical protein
MDAGCPIHSPEECDAFLAGRWGNLVLLHKHVEVGLKHGSLVGGRFFRSYIFQNFGVPAGYTNQNIFWHDFRRIVRFGETSNQRKNPDTGKKEQHVFFSSDLDQLLSLKYTVAGVDTPQQ